MRLKDMDNAECQRRLRAGTTGRVAFSTPTGPHIVPVNYVVVDEELVIRTTPYSLLGTHGRDATIALEIDEIDNEKHAGWSVVVRGRAGTPTGDERRHLPASEAPWAPGRRTLHLLLDLRHCELSGRQLDPPVPQSA